MSTPTDATLVVFCTCPDRDTARRLAASVVERRLAACVNLLPEVESVFRWQGEVTREEEALLIVKTSAARFPALRDHLVAEHPYELPEVLAVEAAAGLDRYLAWVAAESRETSE